MADAVDYPSGRFKDQPRRCMRMETATGPIELYFPHDLRMEDIDDFEATIAIQIRSWRRQSTSAAADAEPVAPVHVKPDIMRMMLEDRSTAGAAVPIRIAETFADALLADLSALFYSNREGIVVEVVMDRYGANYGDALEAMRWLHRIGAGQWVHKRGRPGNSKILVPPDAEVEEHELSERQERVLGALRLKADQHGIVEVNYRHMSNEAKVSPGSMPALMYALEQKGYIALAKPAARNGSKPAVYQIMDRDDVTADGPAQ